MNFETLRAGGFDTDALLSPEAALEKFFANVALPQPRVEQVELKDAVARVLACEVHADEDYPRANRSAMDGFAVRSSETPGVLRIEGNVRMGVAPREALADLGAMRIPTGGILPAGADAVVPIEDASVTGPTVRVPLVPPFDAVDQQGSDMRRGATVLTPGVRLGPAEISLLATVGIVVVPVFSRPRFGVLSSGDEIVAPDRAARPGEVRDSNRYAIGAALTQMGAECVHLPTASDDLASLERHMRDGLAHCDAIVLTGGSSVGERDFTPQAISRLGSPGVLVHGLRVKPGKPTVFGAAGGKPVVGLPGNPTSALAILQNVVAPIVRRMSGLAAAPGPFFATLTSTVRKRVGWTWFVPVKVERSLDGAVRATPLAMRSGHVALLATADGFAVLGESMVEVEAGSSVNIVLL